MSADSGDERTFPGLLAALAAPAVLLDRGGLVAAWNGAAEVRFGLSAEGTGQTIANLVGPLADAGRSVALTDGEGSLVVWSLDDDGLGRDAIALQKADTLGRVAGGVMHEIAGKFTAITGFAELIGSEPGVPPDLREFSGQLKQEADDALRLMRITLEYARHWPRQLDLIALGKEARGIVGLLTHTTMNMECRVTVPDSLPQVEADPALLRQALLALVVNAVEAQGATWGRGSRQVTGRLYISGSLRDDEGGRRVRLAIEDGADVVPEAQRATLFSGSGAPRAGRDLAVARAIIVAAGGRLSYEPRPNGNCLVVELPIAGSAPLSLAAAPSRSPLLAPTADPRPLVLICDDEPLIRGLLVRFLERVGVAAVEARDGREAIAAVATMPIRMIVADNQMPDISGPELYDIIVARHPELATQFILTSGDPGRADIAEFAARTGVPILPKPFDHDRLAALIRDAVAD